MSNIDVIDVSKVILPGNIRYDNIVDYFPYGVSFRPDNKFNSSKLKFNSSKLFNEAKEWLMASFGDGMIGTKWEDRRYLVGIRPRCIFFKNEADFNWFLIRWL